MTLSNAIVQRIKNLIAKSDEIENYHQLAYKAGLNESVIRTILSGKSKNPKAQTIFFISVAFGITISEFYNDPLFDVSNIDDDE